MRIEDKDILMILEKDGPAVLGYIAERLNITIKSDRQKLGHHLKMLTIYGFLQRTTQEGNYIYSIPGDKRPVNYPPNHMIPKREKLRELVNNMEPGEIVDRKQIQEVTGYSRKWAYNLLNRTELKPVNPPKRNIITKWKKEAQE